MRRPQATSELLQLAEIDESPQLEQLRALENGLAGLEGPEKKLAQVVLGMFDKDKDGKLSAQELESARAALRAQGFDTGLRRTSLIASKN